MIMLDSEPRAVPGDNALRTWVVKLRILIVLDSGPG